jgi:hypothetical protein
LVYCCRVDITSFSPAAVVVKLFDTQLTKSCAPPSFLPSFLPAFLGGEVSSKEEEERRLGLCVSNVGNFSGSAPDSLLCVARLLCGVGEGCKIKINRAGVRAKPRVAEEAHKAVGKGGGEEKWWVWV